MSLHTKWIRFLLFLFIILCLSIAVVYISVTNGTYDISPMDVFRTIFQMDPSQEFHLVIFEFRLPRIIIGALVGFALGVAGAVLQGVTRNQLADPGILGIHAAAGMFIVLYIFLFNGAVTGLEWLSVVNMSFFGWIGGTSAALFLLYFSRIHGTIDPTRLILVGIASNAGFSAVTLYISLKMNPQDFEMATVWLSGSIYSASWSQIQALLPWMIIALPILLMKSSELNALQFDDVTTVGIGVRQNKERIILLLCSVALVSASVSVSGSVGFVGLIAPHIARRLIGNNHLYILPISGAIGMLIVMLGDFIGKTVFAPAELPVGIVVSIIGVPYFIYLLVKSRKT